MESRLTVILYFVALCSLFPAIKGEELCENEISTDDGDFDIDNAIVSGTIPLDGSRTFRIRLPDQSNFFMDSLCFEADSSSVRIVLFDGTGNVLRVIKFSRNPSGMSYCLTDRIPAELSKITIRFIDDGLHNAGNVRVLGHVLGECPTTTPSPTTTASPVTTPQATTVVATTATAGTCGISQYPDAAIEGGSVPVQSIVGGWEARPNEFPWQAQLRFYRNELCCCGGSIIDSRYILTAAHCVDDGIINGISDLTVYVGAHSLSNVGVAYEVIVLQIIIHENYNANSLRNDIALLRIVPIPEWTTSVRPICMPTKSFEVHASAGATVSVSGWGNTMYGGSGPDKLNYVNVDLMSDSECSRCLSNVLPGMLCAGECGPNEGDSCQGDSGGPLFRKREDDSFELTGIVSWGYGCASSTPGVYADVYFYKDWILAKADGADLSFD